MYSLNEGNFEDIALQIFNFQAQHNITYRDYLKHLGVDLALVKSIAHIPFLPITFFKTHNIQSGAWNANVVFTSSGTTGDQRSKHLVWSNTFYQKIAERIFTNAFGPPSDFHFLALLPSYLERDGSSLIAMMDYFIRQSKSPWSGFYLRNTNELIQKIESLRGSDRKVVLWGVSFALLELAEKGPFDWSHCMVFETGGMKGRRKELIREELHEILKAGFRVPIIHSEYGMTELMSQAYTQPDGYFRCPPWMKIVIRDINDPFTGISDGKTGGINVVDLANFHSCSFIETQDLGAAFKNGTFQVLGRFDNSDIRGCNLLI